MIDIPRIRTNWNVIWNISKAELPTLKKKTRELLATPAKMTYFVPQMSIFGWFSLSTSFSDSKGPPFAILEILGDFEQYRGGGQLPRTPSPYVFLARRRREKYNF